MLSIPPSDEPDPASAFLRRLRGPDRRGVIRAAGRGAASTGALVIGVELVRVLFGPNLHAVEPGRVYRSAQLSPPRLQRLIADRHIRTVVNLRGCCSDCDWYLGECRATHEADIAQEDVSFSATRLPAPAEVRRLIEVLDRTEYPIVLHCRQGVDRTGLAAAIVLLLDPAITLAQAKRQLSLRYSYVAFGGTESMRQFLGYYEGWLNGLGVRHAPELFRDWVERDYCPGMRRADLELLDPPARVPMGRQTLVRLRATNRSIEPWRFTAGGRKAVRIAYTVIGASGAVRPRDYAGRFDAVVLPGEAVEVDLVLPPLPPGRYTLSADGLDPDENTFGMFGSEPLTWEFGVGE